ncbi:MAG: deoxyribonuclease IV [Candidatus Cloacimonetes bacterium]|nr:deoxyribonuclease IV [Candidatus Cloacimonadota bacterium]
MKYIGAHVSASGGVEYAPQNAQKTGACAFAFFVKNQKRWFEKPLEEEAISRFKAFCHEYGYSSDQILPHGSYLVNIGSPEPEKLQISRESLIDEMIRCELLGLKFLNIHLGAHKKMVSEDECLQICAETLNLCHQKTKSLIVVIENSAGEGSRMGYRFEHLSRVIELVADKERIGVCLDTCHAFGAGYDLRTEEVCQAAFSEFDRIVGFQWLRGMHLNDSMIELGSRKDRHAPIGEGLIGKTCFQFIMQDDRFAEIPLILETPEPEKWQAEIKMLYNMCKENQK